MSIEIIKKATPPIAITGALTDTELRATAVPVSGPLTDTELRATAVPVSGPLTDTELRAADVVVSLDGESVAVTGPLTDTELRATAVPVSDAGAGWDSASLSTTSADMSGGADLTAAPTAGQKIVIDDVLASSAAALYIDFVEETSGTVIFRLHFAAGSTAQFTPRGKLTLATADKKLRGVASGAGNVAVLVLYHSEA